MKHKRLLIFFSTALMLVIVIYAVTMLYNIKPAAPTIVDTPIVEHKPSIELDIEEPILIDEEIYEDSYTEQQPDEDIIQQVEDRLAQLTLEEKIGQLLIVGIEDRASSVSTDTRKLIAEQGIGNIILFKRNIGSEQQLTAFIHELKKLPSNDIPLWVTIDQEGGKVNRLPEQFPSAGELGELNDTAITQANGDLIGKALADFSIDMNFSPVLDINSNPNNPVIGSRAFGATADSVTTHSTAMLEGLGKHVLTVGKHFPGHGDTTIDSHIELPVIDKSWDELEQLELLPFRTAIDNDIDAIMVGHLLVPKLDADYPASLSETIISYYLRKVLQFDGLIITDDLIMGGITEQYELSEAAVKAIQAGNTMLIIGHKPKQQQLVRQRLIEAVEQGEIDEALIDERVRLVLSMKLNMQAYLQ